MALVFMDNFSKYGSSISNLVKKWTSKSGASIGLVAGRFGTNTLRFLGTSGSLNVTGLSSSDTYIFSGAMHITPSFTPNIFFRFRDAGTTQMALRSTANGRIEALRGTSTVIATSTLQMNLSRWITLEVKAFMDNSVGTIEVRIDGVTFIDFVGDTQSTANASMDELYLSTASPGSSHLWEDPVLMDDTGSAPLNDFIGDVRIQSLVPDGDSAQIDFTPVGSGTTNSDRVDDGTAGPDSDTTHVGSLTVGHKDRYTVSDLTVPNITTVFAVQNSMCAAMDTAGSRSAATVLQSGATEVSGATNTLSTTYIYKDDFYENDPNTAAPWTETNVNAIEIGQEVIS